MTEITSDGALCARHGFETWAHMALPGCPEVIAMLRPAGGIPAPPTDAAA